MNLSSFEALDVLFVTTDKKEQFSGAQPSLSSGRLAKSSVLFNLFNVL